MSIEIRGIRELRDKLNNIQELNAILRPPMQRAVYRLQARMAEYPAARKESKYKRTGTLGRRWTVRVTESPSGLQGVVGNNTTYGPWVQSSRWQAHMHRGRWQTDAMVVDQERENIITDFENAIEDALEA